LSFWTQRSSEDDRAAECVREGAAMHGDPERRAAVPGLGDLGREAMLGPCR
jgi:hypothetical protein